MIDIHSTPYTITSWLRPCSTFDLDLTILGSACLHSTALAQALPLAQCQCLTSGPVGLEPAAFFLPLGEGLWGGLPCWLWSFRLKVESVRGGGASALCA